MIIIILVLAVVVGIIFRKKIATIIKTHKKLKDVKHNVLKKDESLIQSISTFMADDAKLAEEFKALEDQVRVQVLDTTIDAKTEENLPHNRFKDIEFKRNNRL